MKTNLKMLMLYFSAVTAMFLIAVSGCDDSTTDPPLYGNNPNVLTFDSIGVEEDSAAFQSYTGINLLTGTTTIDTSGSRDCSLQDRTNGGFDFYLQNGQLLDNLIAGGFEIRFFRVSSDMNVTTYDTLSKVPGYVTFVPQDFTDDNTASGGVWGYFNAPLSTTPVYCFWLKGKKDAGVTPKNVYGILQPREATDRSPNEVYGYRMSFRVRINTNGENDFRKQILLEQ